jgi:glycogen(starch) synthase
MRVLLVADVAGGVATFVSELAAGLCEAGVELHLALLGRRAPAALERLPLGSLHVRELALEWMEQPWADVAETERWIAELVRRLRCELVHMNTFAGVRDPAVPVLLTVHSCVLTWWRAVYRRPAPAGWDRYRALAAGALARAERVVAPSRALLQALQREHGPLVGARVIHNGIALPPAPAPAAREPLVLGVGRLWDEAKNAALLARAAPRIEGRVALIGPGVVASAEALGPLPRERVLTWMRRAAVFAEPARYEPFGLAALEAALCGCALVLGEIPSLREVWADAAHYVAPDDLRGLVAAVGGLLADPGARAAAAAAARERALRYGRAAMSGAYLGLYRQLCARPGSGVAA